MAGRLKHPGQGPAFKLLVVGGKDTFACSGHCWLGFRYLQLKAFLRHSSWWVIQILAFLMHLIKKPQITNSMASPLRSGDPRGAVWRLPHHLMGGGAVQGEGSPHVGRELLPLQLCLRSLGGLRALRCPTATCPAAGLPLRTRSAPRPPAASLWWVQAVGQSLRGG